MSNIFATPAPIAPIIRIEDLVATNVEYTNGCHAVIQHRDGETRDENIKRRIAHIKYEEKRITRKEKELIVRESKYPKGITTDRMRNEIRTSKNKVEWHQMVLDKQITDIDYIPPDTYDYIRHPDGFQMIIPPT